MPPDIRLEGRNPVAKPIPTHAESSNPPDDTFVASVSHVGGLRSNSPSDNSTEQQVAHWLLDGWQVLVRSGNQCLEMGHQPTPPARWLHHLVCCVFGNTNFLSNIFCRLPPWVKFICFDWQKKKGGGPAVGEAERRATVKGFISRPNWVTAPSLPATCLPLPSRLGEFIKK